jgi:hypothetical protein
VSVPAVICLGRIGDIINALPIAYALHQERGIKPKFACSHEFASILDGVTYVQPVVWCIDYKELPLAIKRAQGHEYYVVQAYKHPDQDRKTESYQKEGWRIAGWLDRFGKIPLVFDNRSEMREKDTDFRASLLTNPFHVNKTTILVAGTSVSSPFKHDLVGTVRKAFPGHNVVDLSLIKCHRPYDLLGLMDNAACLVTVDTMHLHLARAANVPIVALINEGWFGSIPQGNVKSTIRYSQFTPDGVVSAIRGAIS